MMISVHAVGIMHVVVVCRGLAGWLTVGGWLMWIVRVRARVRERVSRMSSVWKKNDIERILALIGEKTERDDMD